MRRIGIGWMVFFLASCDRTHFVGVDVDSALRGYVLPGAKAMAGIDVAKVEQTDFYKRHKDLLNLPQLNQLPGTIGMDPRKDLSNLLMTWNGKDALVVTRGSFSAQQIEQRLAAISVPTENYNKAVLFGDGKRDVALLKDGVALAGAAPVVKKMLDQEATGGGGIPEDLKLQLARLNSGAQAWIVTNGVIPTQDLSMRSDAATTLSNISDFIEATAIGLTVGSGLALDAKLSCTSEEGAKRVNDALRGVIGLARLNTPDNQLDQLKMWDSLHVTKDGTEVRLTAELTPQLADRLVAMWPGLARRF